MVSNVPVQPCHFPSGLERKGSVIHHRDVKQSCGIPSKSYVFLCSKYISSPAHLMVSPLFNDIPLSSAGVLQQREPDLSRSSRNAKNCFAREG